jgi:hypothetical protein
MNSLGSLAGAVSILSVCDRFYETVSAEIYGQNSEGLIVNLQILHFITFIAIKTKNCAYYFYVNFQQ